jgi:hypothetical protein
MGQIRLMPEKSDAPKQVRLDDENYLAILEIKKQCDWPVSITVLANHVFKHGISRTRQTFITRKSKP